MNRLFMTGRTTADVEVRYASSDDQTAIGAFSIAVDDGYGDNKHTSFFPCTIFGKRAEAFAKYVPKGTKVAIEGRARQETWKDQYGNSRSAIKFIVTDWEFAQSKGVANDPDQASGPNSTDAASMDDFMNIDDAIGEELPFN